jgi:short-subunit dehydrogenase
VNTLQTTKFLQRFGPTAVITGASSGIGRALAKELASLGLNLILVGRNETNLMSLTGELTEDHGPEFTCAPILADLATRKGIETVLAATKALDVGLLVAAAGFGTAGSFLDSDLATETELVEVNCGAPLMLAHHFGNRFAARGSGGIILFGSLVGFQGSPRAANYAATKAYIQTLAEGLHHELKPRGIAVLAVAPGPVRSGFAERSGLQMGKTDSPEQVARGTLQALGRRMTVVPGPFSKFLTASLMTAPRPLRVRIMGKIMSGMTRELP